MKWEYKVIKIESLKNLGDTAGLQDELNKYGEEGWELVGVIKKPQVGQGWLSKLDDGSVIFKRLISVV